MLKYNDIITKLTDEQKIRILTGAGSISGKDMKILGIPEIKAIRLKDIDRDVFPHVTSLADSWNTDLWGSVAFSKLSSISDEQKVFAIVPGARIKLSPYRKEVSEDPYLASMISASFIKAATDAGVSAGAAGYYLTESDAEWLDKEPNQRILNEYVAAPYMRAGELGGSNIIITDVRTPNEAYKDSCEYIQNAADESLFVCETASDEHTVDFVSRGIVCLKASQNALRQALSRYKKLKQLLDSGKDITLSQLEDELANRTAISEESVNAALDKTLEFIFKCADAQKPQAASEEIRDALALEALRQSTVLLKNSGNILPVEKGSSICVIGGIGASEDGEPALAARCGKLFEENGYKKVSIFKGYNMLDYGYIDDEAVKSSARADITVLLLGSGRDAERRISKTEKLTLPPNQLRLAHKLAQKGKRVVAVILSEHAPDIEFSRELDAVLLAPTAVKQSADAIVDILSGMFAPSGRLAYTLYAGTETAFRKSRVYNEDYGMHSGPFIGYRYYDTAGMQVGYPFGYGLSYTDFVYSKLSISGNMISFNVRNAGKVAAAEVAQIYAGHRASSVLRPKKELCGFARVELKPGEKKRITLKLELPKVFDGDGFVQEKGIYDIYVGASVSDIRLKGKYSADGSVLLSDGEALSRYLQTYSNILEDNFTLEANYGSMKKTVKNILVGIGSLALAVSLAVFNITTGAASVFLGVLAGILAVVSIIFFIIEAVERSRAHAAERKRIAEANKEYFEEAEQIPVLSTDRMFKDEFDAVKEERIPESDVFASDNEFDNSEYIDDKFRIIDAVNEFNKFASDRGYKLGNGVAENLFSSLTVSRLMIFNGLSTEEFNGFIGLLSEYFESIVCVDNASKNESENESSSVFFSYDHQWDHKNKSILNALQAASGANKKIQISAIDGITAENVNEWLEPFMKYVRSPKKRNEISVFDGYGKNYGYNIARNLWIVLRLEDGQTIDTLPDAVVKSAAVVKISFVRCQEEEDRTMPHGFTSYQADYMVLKESGRFDISEEIWKKIDRLEKYASDYSDYAIGNKLWRDLEKQLGMLLSCNFEMVDAVDAAIAGRLLPSVTAKLRGKLGKEDKTVLQSLEFIFGEDSIQYSKAFIDSLTVLIREEKAETVDESVTEMSDEPANESAEEQQASKVEPQENTAEEKQTEETIADTSDNSEKTETE